MVQHMDQNENDGEWITQKQVENRMLLISQPIDDSTARKVVTQVMLMDEHTTDKPINVYVNSPGGSADSGFAIYDFLRFSRSPIRTLCTGLCASAGVLCFLGGDDGKRYSLENSRFMIHQPRTMVTGAASDIEIGAKEIIRLRDRYNETVAQITGRSKEEVDEDVDRDFWMEADEAKDYGLVDEVITHYDELE